MDVYHKMLRGSGTPSLGREAEIDPQFWADEARTAIEAKLRRTEPTGKARNIVMFLGDGMSVPTLTAARTLLGQRQGADGEEAQLEFEKFPTTGLSKVINKVSAEVRTYARPHALTHAHTHVRTHSSTHTHTYTIIYLHT